MESIESRAQAAQPAPARPPRITNACEACRAAKVKCQASSQLGICKRCLDSKRECIFKTGPRTRRPRRPKRPDATTTASSAASPHPLPPPPGPSKTFTIDIPMATNDDDNIADSLETLRLNHESSIDQLVPHVSEAEDDEYAGGWADYDYDAQMEEVDYDWLEHASGVGSVVSHASSLPVGASALSTPPSSVVTSSQGQGQGQSQGEGGGKPKSRTLASLRLQPQFNLDSAGKLLATFRDVMLSHFHCVVVREEDTVASMAKDRPFVLLAVLAAASGSRTLQGHSLYDEEFRKILGLKFVAGGERSMELLQGLTVYIAWYPFHLRPKNKQAFQYARMVVDIVNDLELDQDPGTDSFDTPPTPERLDQIRLYLASYYLASSYASTWNRTPSLTWTPYTARCCDLLQAHTPHRHDHILAWQVRLERLIEETNDLRRTQRGHSQSESQISLMLRGMEHQLTDWESSLPHNLASNPSLRIATLFARIFLSGAPLLKLPSVKLPTLDAASSFRADPERLMSVVPHLHALWGYFVTLKAEEINAFIGIEWCALILSVILGFRMSFPLVMCPEWDDRVAREAVGFSGWVERLCRMGGGEVEEGPPVMGAGMGMGKEKEGVDGAGQRRSMDVLSAGKIVLGVVKRKFLRRVAKLEGEAERERRAKEREQREQQEAMPHPHPGMMPHDPAISGCPMMDGSLEPYYPYWDETFTNNLVASAFVAAEGREGEQGTTQFTNEIGDGIGVQNDLWAAMTMGWAAQGGASFDAL